MSRRHTPAATGAEPAPLGAALAWLRQHAAPAANLHADTRALQPGDVFCAYAVDGADNRAYIDAAFARGAAAVLYQPEGLATPPAGPPEGSSPASPLFPLAGLDQLAGPLASAWYGSPSATLLVLGVTGTNGKTSCSHWAASALTALGTRCALIGTLGSGFTEQLESTGFTTPDAPQLQHSLARFAADGAQAVAMEVSSHALHQGRCNGTAFDIAIFTNLTQDHLDYHHTFEAYEAVKGRLFDWPGLRAAVINDDDAAGRRLLARLQGKLRTWAYALGAPGASDAELAALSTGLAGRADSWLLASEIRSTALGSACRIHAEHGTADLEVATFGRFNISNLLAVLGALLAADVPFDAALKQLRALQPVRGRMQRLGGRLEADEPLVVIDYAHTPDALEQTLGALAPVAAERGGALICVFGCGGDRDTGKRPLMGEIAARLADQIVLTSDNPRSETPSAILEQIAAGIADLSKVRSIEDRASAILQAIRGAARADVVVLAGKGHEATQEINGKKRPFSDQDHARLALAARAAQAQGEGL